ncbi:MAG: flagellar basal-body rod modification protein FlgD [Clostridiales bacterium]|jgi:flagellar basal-body rod modification protein FlgD|nr:flagellar basal-body rod modification protein FlgD [Clostridiales bacterium]MDK2932286.1 flagellar basal-body rod modification protein FlgD [Clostridiales bacterium]
MSTTPVQGQKIVEEYFTMPAKRNPGNLGKDDFLNLLVTQLKYQDPLKPMEDKEFIAQMAQFSSLEQMQNMNATFNSIKAFSMIGKEVLATIKDEESGELKEVSGVVESVKLAKGKTYAVINGKDVLVDDITDVFDTPPMEQSARITDFTDLINKNVTAAFIDGDTLDSINITGDVSSLSLINGTVYSIIDNVEVMIEDVLLNEEEKANFVDLQTYLEEKMQSGEEITALVMTKDIENNTESKVTVTGVLKDFEINEDGEVVSAVISGIKTPANNIMSIR